MPLTTVTIKRKLYQYDLLSGEGQSLESVNLEYGFKLVVYRPLQLWERVWRLVSQSKELHKEVIVERNVGPVGLTPEIRAVAGARSALSVIKVNRGWQGKGIGRWLLQESWRLASGQNIRLCGVLDAEKPVLARTLYVEEGAQIVHNPHKPSHPFVVWPGGGGTPGGLV